MTIALTVFQGRAGDRNGLGVPGAQSMGSAMRDVLEVEPAIVGTVAPAPYLGWREELDAALPDLKLLSHRLDTVFTERLTPVTALPRCATALATIPVVAHHRPDACIVWFDAHADLNTPQVSDTGYLGGLVLAAAAGLWDSGLGDGLSLDNIILGGVRDIDAPEQALIDSTRIIALAPRMTATPALREAVAGRPVYVHIDCDVLDPGITPTEYNVPGGMTLLELKEACAILAECEVIGLEIAEFQATDGSSGLKASAAPILDAVAPLIAKLREAK